MGRRSLTERIESGEGCVSVDEADGEACVVACPPHPLYGGKMHDARLRAVSDSLVERRISCVRFDYGEWDEGEGEAQDVVDAIGYARERWSRVGVFGYSFGAGVASVATSETRVDALGLLAPPDDAADYLEDVSVPVYVVAGTDDTAVDSERVVGTVGNSDEFDTDHFFAGYTDEVAERFAEFFSESLAD